MYAWKTPLPTISKERGKESQRSARIGAHSRMWSHEYLVSGSNNIAVSSCKLVLEPFITPFPLKELALV